MSLTLVAFYSAFILALFLYNLVAGLFLRERSLIQYALLTFSLFLIATLSQTAVLKDLGIISSDSLVPSILGILSLLSSAGILVLFARQRTVIPRAGLVALGATSILILVKVLGLIPSGTMADTFVLVACAIECLALSIFITQQILIDGKLMLTEQHKLDLLNERSAIIRQVSHDIRSPLSALSMVVGSLDELPEARRLLIRNATQRINDITNDLLKRDKSDRSSLTRIAKPSHKVESEPQMIVSLIDSIVSEKRLQYRERMNIEIQGDLELGFGLFVQINPADFSQAISNLIDNSIRAVGECGLITLSVVGDLENVKIYVHDNGCGISPDLIERLEQAQEGEFGIARAKGVFAAAGGSMNFAPEMVKGALVEVLLPRAETPRWFVPTLPLREGSLVISVDDDQTIHQIWKGRFASAQTLSHEVEHLTFSSVDQFENWTKSHQAENQASFVYLVDYEFLGQDRNGLDVIEKLGLASQAILVTSRYEEPQIRQRAERLGVRILPKSLAPVAPIEIKRAGEKLDAVLIDDDTLVHMSWEMAARAAGRNLRVFSRAEDFMLVASEIDLASPLYIDVNLGRGIKGQDVALEASQLGFSKIFLATGYDASDVLAPACVNGIIGKDPVF